MPPPFQQLIRPLPMMKAKVARPTGHQTTKPRIVSAIQAGFPNSSSFATIGMWASHVNVNYIYIARTLAPGCQADFQARRAFREDSWERQGSPVRADRAARPPPTAHQATLAASAAQRRRAR